MPFKLPLDIARLSEQELADLISEGTAEFDGLVALESPSDTEVSEAERISPLLRQLTAEAERRQSSAASRAERMAAVRAEHAPATAPAPDPEPQPEPQPEPSPRVEHAPTLYAEDLVQAGDESDSAFASRQSRYPKRQADPVAAPAAVEPAPVVVVTEPSVVAAVAARTARPLRPAQSSGSVSIIASADVPEFSTGSRIEDMLGVGKAVVNRMKGFPGPQGNPQGQMHQYGVASFRKEFDPDLTIGQGSDDYSVIQHAAKEARLPGGSLVAAGGWCAPSQVLYDLCVGETTDGILSIPEVAVTRGGIKYTRGPDFSYIYANTGFCQTEAEAIAGTAKPCYTVECPPFVEVRLDACGVCIKVPILTNAAYPELVARVISGALIAHQHKMNVKVINSISTAIGTAATATDWGGAYSSTLAALELASDGMRTKWRLGFNETMEVVAPFWLQGAIQSDLANRTGQDVQAVTDEQITAAFAARKLNVQWVVGYQDLAADCPTDYPADAEVLMYPAGSFVKGTSSIINLSAVYDAASLAQNTYTGLFFEEGVLVAQTCYSACKLTVPVCIAGRTGAHDVVCAVGP